MDLAYDPVAEDGKRALPARQLPCLFSDEDASGKPLLVEQLDPTQYQSFPLVESRAFAFDLSSLPRDMRVTDMDISIRYAYYSYQVSLYNPTTGEWDEYKRYTVDDITGLARWRPACRICRST